jgi:transcriptional antiterminator NusG
MNWYAIRTQNNKEKSVMERLQLEINRAGLNSSIGRTLIPVEKVMASKGGKKFFRERTIYPGYIFVETSALGELKNIIKGIDGAAGLVRSRSGDISPIKESEVTSLLSIEDEKREVVEQMNKFAVGDEVKINDGPFDTFKGKITEINSDKQRCKIGVLVFGRITNIELNYDQIERIY